MSREHVQSFWPFIRLLKNTFRRHSERSEDSLFDQNAEKRENPHFADFVRNDEFGVSQQGVSGFHEMD